MYIKYSISVFSSWLFYILCTHVYTSQRASEILSGVYSTGWSSAGVYQWSSIEVNEAMSIYSSLGFGPMGPIFHLHLVLCARISFFHTPLPLNDRMRDCPCSQCRHPRGSASPHHHSCKGKSHAWAHSMWLTGQTEFTELCLKIQGQILPSVTPVQLPWSHSLPLSAAVWTQIQHRESS